MNEPVSCSRCLRVPVGYTFWLQDAGGRHLACLRCALTDRALLGRSVRIAAIVGTVLTAINQGNVLASGVWPSSLTWKIPLTYAVPFTVAMWSALDNLRGPRGPVT